MDGYFSPPGAAKLNAAAENVFLRRENGEKKQLPASGSPLRPEGTRASVVPLLTVWLFIEPLREKKDAVLAPDTTSLSVTRNPPRGCAAMQSLKEDTLH